MDFKKKKYIKEFSPFGQSPNGQFTIKTDDSLKFPLATVFVPVGGPKNVKQMAEERADHIIECLNSYVPK
ncbi:hypothetical protein [uncultured Tenacibaculum sp.]|uniref:hypothetical protein n=1 Tax=uncultured Tenacibaculum sp. TaxID=174713 RepID=UPI0026227CE5|nr:hypothetical protein [uncultured Tenacibaculum sp.]